MRKAAFLVALALPALPALAGDDPRVAWLAEHAVPIRSIDVADGDFADLEPLIDLIGDARIVQLGEESHGDGTAFLAKTRLVRFLHERMGFDVLAFESGLYDCRKAWEALRAGEDPATAVRKGVFGIWTQSEQVRPLIEYLGRSARSPRPIEICGFDCQLTGSVADETLIPDLRALLEAVDPRLATSKHWLYGSQTLNLLFDYDSKIDDRERSTGLRSLEFFREALGSDRAKRVRSTREREYWIQLLRSLGVQIDVHRGQKLAREGKPADRYLRDAQMAKNLIWLAERHYPDRKIIVWAATFHIMRNPSVLKTPDGTDFYADTVPMGHIVWQHFGDEVYTLGFSAHRGTFGAWHRRKARLVPWKGESFENLCAEAGLENAVIDFRSAGPGGKWLGDEILARPLGYAPMKGDWIRVLDGIVFTREMTPSTQVGAPPPAEEEIVIDLPSAVATYWTELQSMRKSGNPWFGKKTFVNLLEKWRDPSNPDPTAVKAATAKLEAWLAENADDPELAWRVHQLTAEMTDDATEKARRLDAAIAAYPDRPDPQPAKHSLFQHLVNERADLVWTEKGYEAALAWALDRLATDRRFHYFYTYPWQRRLQSEGDADAYAGLLARVRGAYAKRAERFPDLAAEIENYAGSLR